MIDHMRHVGLFPALDKPVRLIGAGGIGAMTAVMLAKMSDGDIDIYDDDTVDSVNLATQLHMVEDLDKPKAYAVTALAGRFTDSASIWGWNSRFPRVEPDETEPVQQPAWLIVSAVDSISSRKDIWNYIKTENAWQWYLDARMGAEKFELYCISRDFGFKWYDSLIELQQDGDIPDEPCTAKATFYTAAFAAGHIGKTIKKIVTGAQPPLWLSHNIIDDKIEVVNGFSAELARRTEVVLNT